MLCANCGGALYLFLCFVYNFRFELIIINIRNINIKSVKHTFKVFCKVFRLIFQVFLYFQFELR